MTFFALKNLVLILTVFGPIAQASSRVGNGAGIGLTDNNPWFVGNSPISYCIETDPQLADLLPELNAITQAAMHDWSQTLMSLRPVAVPSQFLLENSSRSLTTSFKFSECNETTELRFLVGKTNSEIDTVLRTLFSSYVGFSMRSSYDVTTGRGKGIVWISGRKAAQVRFSEAGKASFYNVVAHELGHVFGFDHTDWGVMSARLVYLPATETSRLLPRQFLNVGYAESSLFCGQASENGRIQIKAFFDLNEKPKTLYVQSSESKSLTYIKFFNSADHLLAEKTIDVLKWDHQNDPFANLVGHYRGASEYDFGLISSSPHAFISTRGWQVVGAFERRALSIRFVPKGPNLEFAFELPGKGIQIVSLEP